jgi:hypothetical protein
MVRFHERHGTKSYYRKKDFERLRRRQSSAAIRDRLYRQNGAPGLRAGQGDGGCPGLGVRIGHAEVVSTAILIDGPDDKTLSGVDGYLGPATLQAKRIEFDFDAKVLRWQ